MNSPPNLPPKSTPKTLDPREIWEKGACRDAPADDFYPERDAHTYPGVALDAKSYCHGTAPGTSCPVLLECLFYALVTKDRFGIWGGMSPRERSALRRSRSLGKYRYAQQHLDSPYYGLIEDYLKQQPGDSQRETKEEAREEKDEDRESSTEDVSGRDEA